MIPYGHQNDCLSVLTDSRNEGKDKVLVVMAPGLGKTVTIAFDVRKFVTESLNSKILYLCHQNDVLYQAQATFEIILNARPRTFGFLNGVEKNVKAKHLFASLQTMSGNLERFHKNEFDYIIVDECHHAPAETFKKVVDYFEPRFLLGVTATPERTDDGKSVQELFGGKELYSLPLEEAMVRGLLAKVDYRIMSDEIVKMGAIKDPAKISLKKLNQKIFMVKRDEEIAKIIQEKAQEVVNPRTMIFCSSVRHAELLSKHIPNSYAVHSSLTKGEQETRIREFRSGEIGTIITVDKFNEGIDIPEVNVVVFLRSTNSWRVFCQQLGRGLRKIDGKEKVLILDFVANYEHIEMVDGLYKKIQAAIVRHKNENKTSSVTQEQIIDFGQFTFDETIKSVIKLVDKIRGGYTKERLILEYQMLAEKLGRTPTADDIDDASKEGLTASSVTFRNVFGSLMRLQKEAGLRILRFRGLSKAELLAQYKKLAEKLGKRPTADDLKKASGDGEIASTATLTTVFGSLLKLQTLAGFKESRQVDTTKEELLTQYKALAKKLGRVPGTADIEASSKRKETASYPIFKKVWGDLAEIRKAAGLKEDIFKKFDREKLLEQYRSLWRKLGKKPSPQDVDTASQVSGSEIACYATFIGMFGSKDALDKAAMVIQTPLVQKLIKVIKPIPKIKKTTDDLVNDSEWLYETGHAEKDIFAAYMKEITKYKVLGAKEEKMLYAEVLAGDHKARELFIKSNLRLVIWVANKFRSQVFGKPAIDIMDLIQEGNKGLLRALSDFSADRGKFSTYAFWWIEQHIMRFLDNNSRTVRVPVHMLNELSKIRKAEKKLTFSNQEVNAHSIAELVGLDVEKVNYLLEIESQKAMSIDKPFDDGEDNDSSYADILGDIGVKTFDELLDRKIIRDFVQRRIKVLLSIREFQIIEKRFGFGDKEEQTLEEVGQVDGVTRERIRQIEKIALEKIANDYTSLKFFMDNHHGKKPGYLELKLKHLREQLVLERSLSLTVTTKTDENSGPLNRQEDPAVVSKVIETVSKFYGIDKSLIYADTRKVEVVKARHVSMYVLREVLDMSFPAIGVTLGDRDHTTVMHGYQKIANSLANDMTLFLEVLKIKEVLSWIN